MSENLALSDATVLLTGATGGVGQELARALHGRGARLILTGRRTEVLRPLAEELGATTIAADLAERADLDRLLAEAGSVDVLVANAGLPASGPVLEFTGEELERALQVNLSAPILMAHRLAEQMQARGRGHLCFVGSLAGIATSPGSAVYNATKFGLRGFALGLRHDLHGTGVGVSIVEPGFIRDAGMFADAGSPLPPGVRTVSLRQVTDAVITAIEADRGEVIVAPFELRVAATIGSVLPGLSELVQRGGLAQNTSRRLASGQRDKR
jgi:short-subunit dehydrogenase